MVKLPTMASSKITCHMAKARLPMNKAKWKREIGFRVLIKQQYRNEIVSKIKNDIFKMTMNESFVYCYLIDFN
jgi:hypothetical protein